MQRRFPQIDTSRHLEAPSQTALNRKSDSFLTLLEVVERGLEGSRRVVGSQKGDKGQNVACSKKGCRGEKVSKVRSGGVPKRPIEAAKVSRRVQKGLPEGQKDVHEVGGL